MSLVTLAALRAEQRDLPPPDWSKRAGRQFRVGERVSFGQAVRRVGRVVGSYQQFAIVAPEDEPMLRLHVPVGCLESER